MIRRAGFSALFFPGKPVLPREIIASEQNDWAAAPAPRQQVNQQQGHPCRLPARAVAATAMPLGLGKFLQWAGVIAALLLLVVIDFRFGT